MGDSSTASAERTFIPFRATGRPGDAPSGLVAACPMEERDVGVDVCAHCRFCDSLYLGSAKSHVACTFSSGADKDEAEVISLKEGRRATDVPITEVMTTGVIMVGPSAPLELVARLFLDGCISGVPVVEDGNKPIGMISKTDLLQLTLDATEAEVHSYRTAEGVDLEFGPGFRPDRLTGKVASDVMMPLTFALPASANVGQAAALMAYEGIHRIVVMADDDTVAGIVSTIDILRWLSQAEGFVVPQKTQLRRIGRLA